MRRLLLTVLLLAACQKSAPPSAAPAESAAPTPATIVVSKDRSDLVFTYVDPTGAFHDTQRVDEVPEASRAQVLVRDLSKSPDELRAADFLYVADLRSPDDKGRFPCGAVSRRAFERQGAGEAAVQAAQQTAAQGGQVLTLYTTSWCGVCKQTKAWLKQRGVAFLERDVERDPGAEAELRQKAQAAGIQPQGVPVIDVAGELMVGFDADALARLLEKKGLARPR